MLTASTGICGGREARVSTCLFEGEVGLDVFLASASAVVVPFGPWLENVLAAAL